MRRNPAWHVDPFSIPASTMRIGAGDLREKLYRMGGVLAHHAGYEAVEIPFAFHPAGDHFFLPDQQRVEQDPYRDWDQAYMLSRGLERVQRHFMTTPAEKEHLRWSSDTEIIGTLYVKPPGIVIAMEITTKEPEEERRHDDGDIGDTIRKLVRALRREGAIVRDAEITWIYYELPDLQDLIIQGKIDSDELARYESQYGEDGWSYYYEHLRESEPELFARQTEDAGYAEDYA